MGGCITPADAKKPKSKIQIQKDNFASQKNYTTIQKSIYKSKTNFEPVERQLPFYKNTTIFQFIAEYEIQQNLKDVSKVQGPKLIRNRIDGSSKVFRVHGSDQINEERLKIYSSILGLEVFKDEEESYIIIDQLCSGPQLINLANLQFDLDQTMDNSKIQLSIYGAILQVYDIIISFHQKGIYLGNLNIFSFRKVGLFSDRIRLTDFNLTQKQSQHDSMGCAHSNSYQSDWEFFGFLLLYFFSNKTPIFIPHKMQYIQFSSLPHSNLIFMLLKGKKIQRKKLQQINPQQILIKNMNVSLGYKFRKDVNQLIKMRKKRNKHKFLYYDVKSLSQFQSRKQENQNQYALRNFYKSCTKISEQYLNRIQVERQINKIRQYIEQLNSQCEEPFMNYGKGVQTIKILKGVFHLTDPKQKLQEFKQCIHQIK